MNPEPNESSGEDEHFYSIEIIARLAGVTPQTVLHYHELGVILPATDNLEFDTEGLRQLRRIEHLRITHGLTDSGLKFISGLLDEIERLRHETRSHRRSI
jgi:DNA-binding transcriptional MerR regulator